MQVYFWLFIAGVCLLLEILTSSLIAIWYSGGAVIAALVARFGFSLSIQIAVFIIISLALFLPTRKLAARLVNTRITKTNAESLVGQICMVSKDIDNLKAEGQVMVKGMEWTARSVRDELPIAKGTKVEIKAIAGVKLMVSPMEESSY